jgi:AraC-like DNA-binding protein
MAKSQEEYMNCCLEFLYYLTRSEGSSIQFHMHECYELVYYIKGAGITNINNQDYDYSDNSFSIIRPGILHDEKHNYDTDVLFIGFKNIPVSIEFNNSIYFDDNSKSIMKILLKIKTEILEKKPHFDLRVHSLLLELIVEIARMDTLKPNSKIDFTHIKNFLDENYTQEINCNTLAELSGYSYHRFRHIFKDIYGISPYRYAMRLRLQNAAKLLKTTTYTISRIGLENGFSNESQFCSLFRKMHGCTPGFYRTNL